MAPERNINSPAGGNGPQPPAQFPPATRPKTSSIKKANSRKAPKPPSNLARMATTGMRGLRACLVCSIVQRFNDFNQNGCPNCEEIIHLKNHPDSVQDCTSRVFEGLICMNSPDRSWVAKWQRIDKCVPGVYAVKVVGELPENIIGALESESRYVRRDGREEDEDA